MLPPVPPLHRPPGRLQGGCHACRMPGSGSCPTCGGEVSHTSTSVLLAALACPIASAGAGTGHGRVDPGLQARQKVAAAADVRSFARGMGGMGAQPSLSGGHNHLSARRQEQTHCRAPREPPNAQSPAQSGAEPEGSWSMPDAPQCLPQTCMPLKAESAAGPLHFKTPKAALVMQLPAASPN